MELLTDKRLSRSHLGEGTAAKLHDITQVPGDTLVVLEEGEGGAGVIIHVVGGAARSGPVCLRRESDSDE